MKHKTLSWKNIKPILTELSSKQLLGLLQDIYNFNSQNKNFFHARFLSDKISGEHLAPYKERIRQAISPEMPWKQGVQLSVGRRVISEFKKANGNIRDTLSLMLYYVECGNDFTLEFGDIDEPFYNSLGLMFSNIVKVLITQDDAALSAEFLSLLEVEFRRVDDDVGWGYPDELRESLVEAQNALL